MARPFRNILFILILMLTSVSSYPQSTSYRENYEAYKSALRDAGITERSIYEINKQNDPDRFILFLSIKKKFYSEDNTKFDEPWFNSLNSERQNALRLLGYEPKEVESQPQTSSSEPQDESSQIKSMEELLASSNQFYSGEYSIQTAGGSNKGTARYFYIDNPNKSSNQTRIFDGDFEFTGGEYSLFKKVKGKFKNDKQVGLWEYTDNKGYNIKVNFNDNGEMEGDYEITFTYHKTVDLHYQTKQTFTDIYKGKIKNKFVHTLAFKGTYNNREVTVNGRYGLGNGHPARTWLISLKDDWDGRSHYERNYNDFNHLPKGDYLIGYTEDLMGGTYWGESDNWNGSGLCYYVDPSNGNRKDAGNGMAKLPFEMDELVVRLLNNIMMRSSKSGVNYHYKYYHTNGAIYDFTY